MKKYNKFLKEYFLKEFIIGHFEKVSLEEFIRRIYLEKII